MWIMAKFLSSFETLNEIYTLIKEAEKNIIIVSPYIKIDTEFEPVLKMSEERDVHIEVIYRKEPRANMSFNLLSGLSNCDMYSLPDLHAKIYANEKTAIISSMNLSRKKNSFSSIEVSVAFGNSLDDKKVYDNLVESFNLLKRTNSIMIEHHSKWTAPAFCIKCGKPLDAIKMNRPFCSECYSLCFNSYHIQGKYCHKCGKEMPGISNDKPMDYECYSTYIVEHPETIARL